MTERMEQVDDGRATVLQRVRAVVGLVVMVVVLGVLVATALGTVVVALAAFVDQALE